MGAGGWLGVASASIGRVCAAVELAALGRSASRQREGKTPQRKAANGGVKTEKCRNVPLRGGKKRRIVRLKADQKCDKRR
jgi:hypothetical protein